MPNFQLNALCHEFAVVFKEAQGLPPKRSHYHQITPMPGAEPVNLRPYRHPWEQKNIIEKMIEEILAARIIKNSRSCRIMYMATITLEGGE